MCRVYALVAILACWGLAQGQQQQKVPLSEVLKKAKAAAAAAAKEIADAKAAEEAERRAKLAAQAKPIPLDWAHIPVSGDKDSAERHTKLKAEYHDKWVVAEGVVRGVQSSSTRSITLELCQPVKRGELDLVMTVHVRFHDKQQAPIRAIADKHLTVKVIGVGTAGSPLLLDEARIINTGPPGKLPAKGKKKG